MRVEILPEESIALRDALRDGRGGGVVTASASTPASTPRVTVQLPVSSAGGTSTSVTADAAGGVSAQARATVPGAGSATLLVPPPSDAPSSRVEVTQTTVSAAPVKPVASVVPSPAIPTSTSGGIYIQAGAFASLGNARRLEADLRDFAPTVVTQVDSGNATLYRVRLGPLSGEADARRLLDRLASAGYGNVMVVAD